MKLRVKWTPGATFRRTPEADPLALEAPPPALVDIHSHILWDMDDGSRDFAESQSMLKIAAENGTTDIVATPHASSRYNFNPTLVAERIKELQACFPNVPRIHAGCDFHLSVGNIKDALACPHKYTINGLNYLMVEFPDFTIPASSDEILRRFIENGTKPVITHPERNLHLQRDNQHLAHWVSMGCLIQVTAQAVTGHFGKPAQKSALSLLESDLVHVIASDGHDTENRPPRLDHAWRWIKRELGDDAARKLLIDNPRAVIAGMPLRSVPRDAENPRPAFGVT